MTAFLESIIQESTNVPASTEGNLNASIQNGTLYLHPDTLRPVLAAFKLSPQRATVARFFILAQTYPTSAARALGWPDDAGKTAYEKLADQLRPHLPPVFFEEPEPRTYGSLNPHE